MAELHSSPTSDEKLMDAAREGDRGAFDRLVSPYYGELHAHCYRMLGGVHDAEDALQDALVGAWRGLEGFEGRSSVRSWLYRIATNSCLKLIKKRPKRLLSADYHPARSATDDLGRPAAEEFWMEPYPESAWGAEPADPQVVYELRESVELAFVAALQHLPATQRAVLIMREVLAFSAAEVAAALDTSVASVNSALQRARGSLDQRVSGQSQQATLRELGDEACRALVTDFVSAWERADVPALVGMLAENARLTMPPLPAWFDGPEDIGTFLAERIFDRSWRMVPASANGQLAFVGYRASDDGARFLLAGLNVVTLRGDRILEITSFLDPRMIEAFGLPAELTD
ncbi:sigma-70 family RNA polymerase sigma factor [Actinoallomurus iriomotensis]|uniref:RNA polymerase sigma factor n=1 Tax=Actinoallomurus iriomotensis TaxID=478107 RepID=A0A9W6RHZ2_9ACTN|nr:sigma-70 family RNA polymerase sigma factor [Actinoallomurus iriomotensis]GLY76159.1 RNA polymerase sigma factor [Actinoallomurus iriomotensis]